MVGYESVELKVVFLEIVLHGVLPVEYLNQIGL